LKYRFKDQKRLLRLIRANHPSQRHLLRKDGITVDTAPKLGGHAFRKRRTFRDN